MFLNWNYLRYPIFFSLRLNDFDFIFRGCTDFYWLVYQEKELVWEKNRSLRQGLNTVIHSCASGVGPLSYATCVKPVQPNVFEPTSRFPSFLCDTAPRWHIIRRLNDGSISLLAHIISWPLVRRFSVVTCHVEDVSSVVLEIMNYNWQSDITYTKLRFF